MTDVSLLWFSIEEASGIHASRQQVREAADHFGLPKDILTSDSKVAAFQKACRNTTFAYTDDDAPQILQGKQAKRTSEFITIHVVREDGYKLAEYKFFQSRRTRTGLVKGSCVVRSVIRQGLAPHQREAAAGWLALAAERYEQYQYEPPMMALRRLVRAALVTACVPVVARDSTFFVYEDQIEVAHAVRDFLGACITRPDFTLLSIDDLSDYAIFAASADDYLVRMLDNVLARIHRSQEPGRPLVAARHVHAWLEIVERVQAQQIRHERRLRLPLPRTSSALLVIDQLVSQLAIQPACRE